MVGNDAYREYEFLGLKRLVNVPYPINIDRYSASPKLPTSEIVFLYSGRFDKNQNTERIVKSFLKACRKTNRVRLVLSGAGEKLAVIKHIVSESAYRDKVLIDNQYGSWFDLPELYFKANVLLAPLEHSGWGFVIQEAMSAGMGVITSSQVSSANEYLIDGYNG